MQPLGPMRLSATCEGWRVRSGGGGPNQTKNQNQKKQQCMNHSLLSTTNTNSAPKSNVTTRTAGIKNTHSRDSVVSNETDEPKMTKAQCNLQSRCRSLQRVRDEERGVVAAAPIKPKIKNQKKQRRMNHSILSKTKQTRHPKAMPRQEQPVSKITYR